MVSWSKVKFGEELGVTGVLGWSVGQDWERSEALTRTALYYFYQPGPCNSPSIRHLHGGRFLYGESEFAPESDAAGQALGRAHRSGARRSHGDQNSGSGALCRLVARRGERRTCPKVRRFSHRGLNGVRARGFSHKYCAQAAHGVSASLEQRAR